MPTSSSRSWGRNWAWWARSAWSTLYGGLAFAGLRIARRVPDTFSRLAAGSITVWLITQAVVNIGAVLGLLPITGVPLPLISAGVSSLIVTLAALGMLLSFARTEPGAAQALAAAGPAHPGDCSAGSACCTGSPDRHMRQARRAWWK